MFYTYIIYLQNLYVLVESKFSLRRFRSLPSKRQHTSLIVKPQDSGTRERGREEREWGIEELKKGGGDETEGKPGDGRKGEVLVLLLWMMILINTYSSLITFSSTFVTNQFTS